MAELSESRAVDRMWRIWPSVAVLAIVLSGALLGVLIIPIVQGRGAGIDPYTAICRALGILPGSPAIPQIASRNPPTPVSQVVWTLMCFRFSPRPSRNAGVRKCRKFAQPVTVSRAYPFHRNFQTWPANPALQFTNSSMITTPAAAQINS